MNSPDLSVLGLELTILVALVGALCVSRLDDPLRAWKCGLIFTGATLGLSLLPCLEFYLGRVAENDGWSLQRHFFGRQWFGVDELSAPLVPLVALLHFLTVLATGRTKMRRFSLSFSLVSEAIGVATFSCQDPGVLVALLIFGVVPPYLELRSRSQPTRLFLLHMALFVGLLILGWALTTSGAPRGTQSAWTTIPLLVAILVRCGSIPAHCWITDWFEGASFGNALLFVTPLSGVYAAVRLAVPIAPDWVLASVGVVSLVTAVYAAGMAVVQEDARRFFGYLFLSHASLILLGMALHTSVSLTGGLALWISAALSLAGLGLTLRALEARFGRLSLARFHGLYDHTPALAVCFLLTGLASVGFPGTFGFVAVELLIDGAVESNLFVGLAIALTAAINGIAVLRAYFLLFTGARHTSTVCLAMTFRERLAVLTLAVLILGGGLFPQRIVESRSRAAMTILEQRAAKKAPRLLKAAGAQGPIGPGCA